MSLNLETESTNLDSLGNFYSMIAFRAVIILMPIKHISSFQLKLTALLLSTHWNSEKWQCINT
jgi:hypothetical protein